MSQHSIYLFFISIISRAQRTSSAARQPWQRLASIPRSVYIAARGVLVTIRLIACCWGARLPTGSPDCAVRWLAGGAQNACGQGGVRYYT